MLQNDHSSLDGHRVALMVDLNRLQVDCTGHILSSADVWTVSLPPSIIGVHLVALTTIVNDVEDCKTARAKTAKQDDGPNYQGGNFPSAYIVWNTTLVFNIGDATVAVRKG
jgi:hypothetical protein